MNWNGLCLRAAWSHSRSAVRSLPTTPTLLVRTMNKLVLAAALVAGSSISLTSLSFGHGGTYRGPGDTVPPGGGGSTGGGPATPGGPGPGTPGGPGPSTGGPGAPGTPGGPGGAGPAAPRTGPSGDSGPDLTAWTFWWEFNKDPYLNLKAHIHSGETTTGSDGWFLGRGQANQSKDSLRPTEQQIRQKVVPALLEALKTESNNDIVTGCLVALAKIGDAQGEDGASEFEGVIADFLDNSVQEIRETAAVALGILSNDSSIERLANLLKDTAAGRADFSGNDVDYRTRSFAAYGLALIGARTGSEEKRQEIVKHLREVLESDKTSSRDLSVGCLIAMGLVPLETIQPPTPAKDGEMIEPEICRLAQISYLRGYLADQNFNYLTRAHAPIAVARLMEGLEGKLDTEAYGKLKQAVATSFLDLLSARGIEKELVQSCVLALGLIGDNDGDKIDQEIRDAIAKVPDDISDQLAKNFATIAMAKIGGTLGTGDKPLDGVVDASKFILDQLTKGKGQLQAWAALSVGVMVRKLADAQQQNAQTSAMVEALRDTLSETKDQDRVGAYALGSAIAGDVDAIPILSDDKLDRMSSDDARGYVAVALGLLGDRDSLGKIQKIIDESKYRPELLQQAAIALGLLGDKALVVKLIDMLEQSDSLATQAAISSALGFIGDQRSIDPLVTMLQNKDLTEAARGFAAVALGIVGDKEALPWNSKVSVDLNYAASTATLNQADGTGILNIL